MSRFSEALLSRVVVRGFRSLEKVAVRLGPLTILVGPNASGKSSFLHALAFMQQAILESPQIALETQGGLSAILTATGSRPKTLSVEVEVQSRDPAGFAGSYFMSFEVRNGRRRFKVREQCTVTLGDQVHHFSVEDGEWKEAFADVKPPLAPDRLALPLMAGLRPFAWMNAALTSLTFYDIAPEAFYAPQAALNTGERLAPRGSNAARVLERLRSTDSRQRDYQRLMAAMSQIVPSIEAITPKKKTGRRMTFEFTERFSGREVTFSPASMSDGTLYALGILLAAYQDDMPTLMAFEEPEKAIHPGAAAVLADVLQEAALRTQILVTTQSPDLLDHFEDTEVLRAVERIADGTTVIAPIVQSQREAILRRLFTPGELHRIEGLRPTNSGAGDAIQTDADC